MPTGRRRNRCGGPSRRNGSGRHGPCCSRGPSTVLKYWQPSARTVLSRLRSRKANRPGLRTSMSLPLFSSMLMMSSALPLPCSERDPAAGDLAAGVARALVDGPDAGEVAGAGGGHEFLARPGGEGRGHVAGQRGGRLHPHAADGGDLDGIVDAAAAAVADAGEIAIGDLEALQLLAAGDLVGRHYVGRHRGLVTGAVDIGGSRRG